MTACKASGDLDRTSAPVILILSSITPVGDTFGDVVNDDGTVADDRVEVEFVARLKASTDPTAPELQEIVIERYEVTYRRTDGGSSTPAGMQRAMTAKVPVTPNGSGADRTLTVTLTLTPGSQKLEPPLSHLISPGFDPDTGNTSIQTDATLTFYGTTIAGDRVSVSGGIGIQFANYAGS
jgi:hypothetical protein